MNLCASEDSLVKKKKKKWGRKRRRKREREGEEREEERKEGKKKKESSSDALPVEGPQTPSQPKLKSEAVKSIPRLMSLPLRPVTAITRRNELKAPYSPHLNNGAES